MWKERSEGPNYQLRSVQYTGWQCKGKLNTGHVKKEVYGVSNFHRVLRAGEEQLRAIAGDACYIIEDDELVCVPIT